MGRLDTVQRDGGQVGARSDAGRDDSYRLSAGNEIVLVLDGFDEGAVGCRAAVGPGVDAPVGVPGLVGQPGDGFGGDVVQGDRLLARQAMVTRYQQHPRLVVQDRHVQLIGRQWQPGHYRVYPVIEQGLAWFIPAQVQGVHVGVGVPAAQVQYRRGDDEVGRVADGDPAGLGGGPGARGGLGG
jgi:hypothetical protein